MEAMMTRQIVRISIGQTSKVMAIMYAAIALVVFVPFAIITGFMSGTLGKMTGVSILMMIAYPLFVYAFTALGCWFYNWIAQQVGGVEFTLSNEGRPGPAEVS
jgi:hypothetical protein